MNIDGYKELRFRESFDCEYSDTYGLVSTDGVVSLVRDYVPVLFRSDIHQKSIDLDELEREHGYIIINEYFKVESELVEKGKDVMMNYETKVITWDNPKMVYVSLVDNRFEPPYWFNIMSEVR